MWDEAAELVSIFARGRTGRGLTGGPLPLRRGGGRAVGRRKIRIEKIKDSRNRSVTFMKRKNGLMKKAMELSVLCGCEVTLLIVNSQNKLFQYSSDNIDATLANYKKCLPPAEQKDNRDILKQYFADQVKDEDDLGDEEEGTAGEAEDDPPTSKEDAPSSSDPLKARKANGKRQAAERAGGAAAKRKKGKEAEAARPKRQRVTNGHRKEAAAAANGKAGTSDENGHRGEVSVDTDSKQKPAGGPAPAVSPEYGSGHYQPLLQLPENMPKKKDVRESYGVLKDWFSDLTGPKANGASTSKLNKDHGAQDLYQSLKQNIELAKKAALQHHYKHPHAHTTGRNGMKLPQIPGAGENGAAARPHSTGRALTRSQLNDFKKGAGDLSILLPEDLTRAALNGSLNGHPLHSSGAHLTAFSPLGFSVGDMKLPTTEGLFSSGHHGLGTSMGIGNGIFTDSPISPGALNWPSPGFNEEADPNFPNNLPAVEPSDLAVIGKSMKISHGAGELGPVNGANGA